MAKYFNGRIEWIDSFRGIAIVLMIIYHFFYDLMYFGWYDSNVAGRSEWMPFRYLILTLFVSLMAVSLNRAHAEKLILKKYGHWLLKVGSAAFAVSVATYFIFPKSWVYFGVLHFMVFSSLFVLLLKNYCLISCVVGSLIIIVNISGVLPYGWPISYIKHVFHSGLAVDYVPLIPWLGVALIASSLSKILCGLNWLNEIGRRGPRFFQILGQHSLLIYLSHQPILFGMMYSYKYIVETA